jgi:hypothetical protein
VLVLSSQLRDQHLDSLVWDYFSPLEELKSYKGLPLFPASAFLIIPFLIKCCITLQNNKSQLSKRKSQGERKIGHGSQMGTWQDGLADWVSVVMWLWLWLSTELGHGLDGWFDCRHKQRISCLPLHLDQPWDPPGLLFNRYWEGSLSLGVKGLGHEADFSPLSLIVVNVLSNASTLLCNLVRWLIENFYLCV